MKKKITEEKVDWDFYDVTSWLVGKTLLIQDFII